MNQVFVGGVERMIDLEVLHVGCQSAVDEDVPLEISRQAHRSAFGLAGPHEQTFSSCSGASVVDIATEEPCADSARVGPVAGTASRAEAVQALKRAEVGLGA